MHEVAVRIDDNVVNKKLMLSEICAQFFEEFFPHLIEVEEKGISGGGEWGLWERKKLLMIEVPIVNCEIIEDLKRLWDLGKQFMRVNTMPAFKEDVCWFHDICPLWRRAEEGQ